VLDDDGGQDVPIEIVGIVGDIRNSDVDQAPTAQVYLPISLSPPNTLSFAVRTSDADSARVAPAVRAAVATLDNEQPIFALKTMGRVVFDDLSGTLLLVSVLMGIALISLSVAAAGIYGLTAYSVTRRTREIGLRMALGAAPRAVLRLVVSSSTRPVVVGALVGTAAAVALGSFASSAIGDVDFSDPVNYIGVVILLVVIALLATIVPAQRATRIHPAIALRSQ
jgi:putative ABC transport system permease protein